MIGQWREIDQRSCCYKFKTAPGCEITGFLGEPKSMTECQFLTRVSDPVKIKVLESQTVGKAFLLLKLKVAHLLSIRQSEILSFHSNS